MKRKPKSGKVTHNKQDVFELVNDPSWKNAGMTRDKREQIAKLNRIPGSLDELLGNDARRAKK